MVARLVKLYIKREKAEDFLNLFSKNKEKIRTFEGCRHLELFFNDGEDYASFVTYSKWESTKNLDIYRKSEVFYSIWPTVKAWFVKDPIAETFEIIE